jgi:hypothetical protein
MPRSDKILLCNHATEILQRVLSVGDVRHPDEDWTIPTEHENMSHARAHQVEYYITGNVQELEHALCRIAMALYKLKHG